MRRPRGAVSIGAGWVVVATVALIGAASACGGGEPQARSLATTVPPEFPTIVEPPKARDVSPTVRKVVDVRTVQLSDGQEITVKGLAAPDECWRDAATTFAQTMLLDKPVDTTPAGSLRLADGTDYAVIAVELGMVRSETTDDLVLREAEQTASAKHLGRWGPPCTEPSTRAPAPAPAVRTTVPKPITRCSVAYRVTNTWPGGFRTDVTIGNTGTAEIDGWTLKWTFTNGQTVSEMWNATPKQTGGDVFATAVSYNQVIRPGETLLMGFTGGSGNTNTDPRAFTLNGHTCTLA